MPVYFGEMQSRDDLKRMPATVTINRGMLYLASGTNDLGEWSLSRVGIEEYTDKSLLLAADDDELILFLDEHAQFIRDNQRYMREPEGTQRRPSHPAFRKPVEDEQSLKDELKSDVSREVTPIVEEAKHLLSLIEPGPPLWIGGLVLIALIVFLPGLVIGVGLLVGVVALVVGGLGYADQNMALRIPDPVTPAMLVMIGTVLLLLAFFVGAVFS